MSTEYREKIEREYPNYSVTCLIVDSPELWDNSDSLPWNNEESEAIAHEHNFRIAMHGLIGQFKSGSPEAIVIERAHEYEQNTGIQTC